MQTQQMLCTKEGKQFVCRVDLCNKSFTSWQGWQYHFLNKHTNIRNPCTTLDCNEEVFPSKVAPSESVEQVDSSAVEATPERDVSLGKRSSSGNWDLSERSPKNRRWINSSGYPTCDICGKKLSSYSNLKVHRNTLHFGQRWKCKICGRTCTSKESVLKTCRKSHEGEDVEFVRPDGVEDSPSSPSVSPTSLSPVSSPLASSSPETPVGDEEDQMETLECIQSIVSLSRAAPLVQKTSNLVMVREHEQEDVSDKDSDPETDYAAEDSNDSDHYYVGEEVSPIESGHKPTCHICGKVFASNSSLKVHKNILHFGKRWKCKICGRVCTKKQNVQATCRRHHSGEDIEVILVSENDSTDSEIVNVVNMDLNDQGIVEHPNWAKSSQVQRPPQMSPKA